MKGLSFCWRCWRPDITAIVIFPRTITRWRRCVWRDPPGFITHYKLRRLTPGQCANLLKEANQRNLITSRAVADGGGECPLQNVVRVRDFGAVKLSSSFLASCLLALSSALYLQQQAKPLTRRMLGQSSARSTILAAMPAVIFTIVRTRGAASTLPGGAGYSGFRLADGERIQRVLKGWPMRSITPGCRRYWPAVAAITATL